jgi:hypothetical protein
MLKDIPIVTNVQNVHKIVHRVAFDYNVNYQVNINDTILIFHGHYLFLSDWLKKNQQRKIICSFQIYW